MENPKFTTNLDKKTITIEHIFPAEPAKVWQAWTSADQLEKWWGPKDWPASNNSFDFKPKGHWHYCMTGPDGTKACGLMDYTHIDEGKWFEFDDFFCDVNGVKSSELPSSHWKVRFVESSLGHTQVTVIMNFESASDLQNTMKMGFEPGFTNALYNLEELLSVTA